ncbi:MAG: TPR end-of-group domain-containing protein [Blastocatellia bacterium]
MHSTPVPVQPPVVTVESHRRQPSAVALKVFEQAVKVFNRRQFLEAKTLFENLIARYPQEVEILARVSTYVHVCNQRLAQSENRPQSADELYDRGVFALNTGNFAVARDFFEKALRARPNEAHLLYSLAVTVLRLGSIDEALGYLKRSFDLQPRFRAQALNDSDFADLREDRKFLNLLGMTSPFDRFDSKR